MGQWQSLNAELGRLRAEAASLKQQGAIAYPASFVLDSSTSRGRVYYRRRVRGEDGKPGKAESISLELYQALNQGLKNGRKLHQIETQMACIVVKLDAIAHKAAVLGLSLPDL